MSESRPKPKPKKRLPKGKGKRKEGRLVEPKKKLKLNLTDEQRKERSDRAKALAASGKIGGVEHGSKGGRPSKKRRATEVMAEGISEMGEQMLGAIKDALHPDNPHSIRLKAVDQATRIEEKEARLQIDEAEQLRKMDHDALVKQVAERFAGNPMVMNIFSQAGRAELPPGPEVDENGDPVIDAEVAA